MIVPTLFTFHRLPEHLIPRSAAETSRPLQAGLDDRLINLVIERWRGATVGRAQQSGLSRGISPSSMCIDKQTARQPIGPQLQTPRVR